MADREDWDIAAAYESDEQQEEGSSEPYDDASDFVYDPPSVSATSSLEPAPTDERMRYSSVGSTAVQQPPEVPGKDDSSNGKEASSTEASTSGAEKDPTLEGGRLWRAAGIVAQELKHPPAKKQGPGKLMAETLFERTRSRADPNALYSYSPATPEQQDQEHGKAHQTGYVVRMSQQDEAFLKNTGLAKKRVRVVQLLIIGLVGLLLGWLGNFFTGTSCNFASVKVQNVGQYEETFLLHFGLWKYSPPDSAFAGYSYCYPYGDQHASDAPIVPRITNLLALVAGTYSLVVLWWYLIFGHMHPRRWTWAVIMAGLAGLLQLSTLAFFVGRLCRRNSCSLGPASMLAVITAFAWAGLAWELHYNVPVEKPPQLANLEMADLQGASQEYYERFSPRRNEHSYRPPNVT